LGFSGFSILYCPFGFLTEKPATYDIRQRTKTDKAKNTTQYVLDATIPKQTQIPTNTNTYKHLEVKSPTNYGFH
jgi:hypothetical protein